MIKVMKATHQQIMSMDSQVKQEDRFDKFGAYVSGELREKPAAVSTYLMAQINNIMFSNVVVQVDE